jgi:hypothetical protein
VCPIGMGAMFKVEKVLNLLPISLFPLVLKISTNLSRKQEKPMSNFPDLIKIKVIDADKGLPLANIAIRVTLFARRKNNYNLLPPVSDEEGVITITKSWLDEEINKERNLFIMDYASSLNDCESKIEINILSANEIENAVKGLRLYQKVIGITDEEIQKIENVSNKEYTPARKLFELDATKEIAEIIVATNKL